MFFFFFFFIPFFYFESQTILWVYFWKNIYLELIKNQGMFSWEVFSPFIIDQMEYIRMWVWIQMNTYCMRVAFSVQIFEVGGLAILQNKI